jgi:hypothetical protein
MDAPLHVTEEVLGSTGEREVEASVDGAAIDGITDWDQMKHPHFIPKAVVGFGLVEQAQFMQKQREKERADAEKARELKRKAFEASRLRVQSEKSVDDHFTGGVVEHAELKGGLAGLVSKEELMLQDQETQVAEEKERKRQQRKQRKKREADKQKLSFVADETDGNVASLPQGKRSKLS